MQEIPWLVRRIEFSPDGTKLVVAATSMFNQTRGFMVAWNTSDGALIGDPIPFLCPANPVESFEFPKVIFHPDSQKLLIVGAKGGKLWDLSGRTQFERAIPLGDCSVSQFSSDGQFFVTGGNNGNAAVWSIGKNDFTKNHELTHPGEIEAVAVSRNDKLIATAASDKLVRIWDVQTGNLRGEPLKHPDHVSQIVFDKQTEFVATLCKNDIYYWDIETGKLMCPPILQRAKNASIFFHPVNNTLIAISDNQIVRTYSRPEPTDLFPEALRQKIRSMYSQQAGDTAN